MSQNLKKVLIIVPAQTGRGGIYNFYENLKLYLPNSYKLYYLRGSRKEKTSNKLIITLTHLKNILSELKSHEYTKVVLNPSLNLNAVLRDSIIALLAFCLRIKVIIFWRGWNFENEKYFSFPYRLITSFLLKSKNVIVLYSKIASSLKGFGFKGNIFFMTTIVNDEAFKYNSNQNGYDKLIFLSRIEKYKGVFELLQAYKILKERHPNITLTIAGQGDAFEEVKQKIKSEGLKDINMPGYIVGKEKYELLAKSSMFLFPSYSEGMPNAVLEAMAIGLPVITTKVGGLNDFFEDGKMGCVIDVKDVNSIVLKFEELFNNNKKVDEIKMFNIKYAKKHFKANHVAQKFLNIIDVC